MDSDGCLPIAMGALLIGCIALIIWAVVSDGKQMAEKQKVFMAACTADGRKPYDCGLQWDTYKAAHDAEVAASMAAASAGAAAARH